MNKKSYEMIISWLVMMPGGRTSVIHLEVSGERFVLSYNEHTTKYKMMMLQKHIINTYVKCDVYQNFTKLYDENMIFLKSH